MKTFQFSGYHPNGGYMSEIYIESKDWQSGLDFLSLRGFTKLFLIKEIWVIKII